MKIRHSIMLSLFLVGVSFSTVLLMPGLIRAGDMEPSGPPASTMHTLEDIYTLEKNIHNKVVYPIGIERTGQTTSYATGDDGDLQEGIIWPDPRFTDNGDGTVTDNLTGLIWLKDAYRFGARTWTQAISDCNALADDGEDLTDGSSAGDWRLPNVKELQSLNDFSNCNPALPSGHPFINVQDTNDPKSYYWSSTADAFDPANTAQRVNMGNCRTYSDGHTSTNPVWPVRDAN
jgi:hypothetical protein